MSEGGGLGLFHGAIAAMDGREAARAQDGAVHDCLTAIIGDEIGHLGGAIATYLASPFSQDTEVLDILGECLARKVEERREQFAPQLCAPTPVPGVAVARYRERITRLLASPEQAAQ